MILLPVKEAIKSDIEALSKTAIWIKDIISEKKIHSGKSRSICPRSKNVIEKNNILLCFRSKDVKNESEVEIIKNLFLDKDKGFYGYSILFVYERYDKKLITNLCKDKKIELLNEKILIGKFHPEIEMRTLIDNTIVIPPCPFPIIAIRRLIKEDVVFFNNQYSDSSKDDEYRSLFNTIFK